MKYLVRLNPRALNPITGKVDPRVKWEVEQAANKDSEKVVWHCEAVTIGTERINENIGKDVIVEFFGIAVRGQDNSITIYRGRHEAD